jgi:putative membrane protein
VTRRVWACAAGLAVLFVAASPLAHLAHHLLTAHMVMHLAIMLAAAPLILSAARPVLARWRFPIAFCWLAATLTVILWHVPPVFELALRSRFWHTFEPVSFFLAGALFWWPVMEPRASSRWSMPVYLFLATLPCDALSAFLVFCGHVVYPTYRAGDHAMFGLSPIEDQALAGALMWVTVTFAYMIPAMVLTARLLAPGSTRASGIEVG